MVTLGHRPAAGQTAAAPGPSRWRLRRLLGPAAQVLLVVATALVSLELRHRVPVVLNLSDYDGLLFAGDAHSIAGHQWLGAFTDITLAKGPGYPLFMAAAFRAGLELKVAEQLVYLAAAATTALALLVTTRRRWLATSAFVLLALDPANFSAASADIFRDGFYASLGLLALSAAFLTVLGAVRRARWGWIVLGALVTGGATGVYWITREESVVLLPSLAIIAGGVLLLAWWTRRAEAGAHGLRGLLGRPAIALVLVAASAAGPLLLVHWENHRSYGPGPDNDMSEGTFMRAYADWTRVEAGPAQRWVPITTRQRAAVYAVSPAARELEPRLEDPANNWRYFGCDRPRRLCDFGGGWMVWAIRDAAASAGHFRDEQDAQAYFARLSEQIDTACRDGALRCRPRLPAALQSFQRAPLGQLGPDVLRLSGDLLVARGMYEPPSGAGVVPDPVRAEYASAIHGLPATAAAATAQTKLFSARRWQYELLGDVYHVVVPLLVALALGGLVVAVRRAVRGRQSPSPLLALAAALAAGVVLREVLIAVIDTADYDAAQPRYQLPMYVLLTAFALVSAGSALHRGEPAARRAP